MSEQSNEQEKPSATKEITPEQRLRNTVVLLAAVGGACFVIALMTLGEIIEHKNYWKILMLPVIGFGAWSSIREALRMK